MCQVTLEIPDASAIVLNVPPENIGPELRMLAAVKLFEMGRISSGAAAEFAGISKPEFLMKLGSYGVNAFDLTRDELEREVQIATSHR